PIGDLGNRLSSGDLSGAIGAANDVLSAINRWATEVVVNYLNTVAYNAAAFASDPLGYLGAVAQQVWDGTKGALAGYIANGGQFIGENVDELMSVININVTTRLPIEASLATKAFGSDAASIVSNVAASLSQLSRAGLPPLD